MSHQICRFSNRPWWNFLGILHDISRDFIPSSNFETVFFDTSARFDTSEVSYTSKMIYTSVILHISTSPGFLTLSPARRFLVVDHQPRRVFRAARAVSETRRARLVMLCLSGSTKNSRKSTMWSYVCMRSMQLSFTRQMSYLSCRRWFHENYNFLAISDARRASIQSRTE